MILGKKVILFGSSGGGQKACNWINKQNCGSIDFFLDNDRKKEGMLVQGKRVYYANSFLDSGDFHNCYIIITSIYKYDIWNQLIEADFPEAQIITKAILFKWIIEHNEPCVYETRPYKQILPVDKKRTIVFDMASSFVLGGVENWSFQLARELRKKHSVYLLSPKSRGIPPEDLSDMVKEITEIDYSLDYTIDSIHLYASELEKLLPCDIFISHIDDCLFGAYLLKRKYKDKINIISVVHGGLKTIWKENSEFEPWIDKYLCVSSDCRDFLMKQMRNPIDKVFYKETFVDADRVLHRQYALSTLKPLRIAYVGRLEKEHKRVDFLPVLVNGLETRNVNYEFDIVGTGAFEEKIETFVHEKKLDKKVRLLGRLPFEKMKNFWKAHDVYINVSECEGCCLSMLEAMAQGAIPVVTDVSSVRWFIQNGEDGYIVDIHNMEEMADKIQYLSLNRNCLVDWGQRIFNKIREKCNFNDYIMFIETNILK